MTPEEQLAECAEIKKKEKRKKRDLYYFVAGFIAALALIGMSYMASI